MGTLLLLAYLLMRPAGAPSGRAVLVVTVLFWAFFVLISWGDTGRIIWGTLFLASAFAAIAMACITWIVFRSDSVAWEQNRQKVRAGLPLSDEDIRRVFR